MRALIVGCGYVGLPLGAELARQGHTVFGIRRSAHGLAELEKAGIKPCVADVSRRQELEALPGPFDWVVNTVSAGPGGAAEYQEVYFNGTRNLIVWLQAAPPKKFVYTSSTGVYTQTDGSAVDEVSPVEPNTGTSRVLRETEQLLLSAARETAFPAVILRVAGIYGPDRGYWFRQYLVDQARIEGDGSRILNMIHRDDLVRIILTALGNAASGEIYNAVDDEPVSQLDFFRWLAETLGKDLPAADPAPASAERKRGLTNKRVLNQKLKRALGYVFNYPTFREGYREEMARLKTGS